MRTIRLARGRIVRSTTPPHSLTPAWMASQSSTPSPISATESVPHFQPPPPPPRLFPRGRGKGPGERGAGGHERHPLPVHTAPQGAPTVLLPLLSQLLPGPLAAHHVSLRSWCPGLLHLLGQWWPDPLGSRASGSAINTVEWGPFTDPQVLGSPGFVALKTPGQLWYPRRVRGLEEGQPLGTGLFEG